MFLQQNYLSHTYLYEKRLHDARKTCMHSLHALYANRHTTKTKYAEIFTKYESLYALFLNIAEVRDRITDYTIFSLCEAELAEIKREIHHVLSVMITHASMQPIQYSALASSIERFDEMNQNILQVTASDPNVFSIMVNSLYRLKDELTC